MDKQVLSFIKKKGILCIPMKVKNDILGSVVLGIDEITVCKEENLKFLTIFINKIALAINRIQVKNNEFNKLKNTLKKVHQISDIQI